jgi:hypothetical protein
LVSQNRRHLLQSPANNIQKHSPPQKKKFCECDTSPASFLICGPVNQRGGYLTPRQVHGHGTQGFTSPPTTILYQPEFFFSNRIPAEQLQKHTKPSAIFLSLEPQSFFLKFQTHFFLSSRITSKNNHRFSTCKSRDECSAHL